MVISTATRRIQGSIYFDFWIRIFSDEVLHDEGLNMKHRRSATPSLVFRAGAILSQSFVIVHCFRYRMPFVGHGIEFRFQRLSLLICGSLSNRNQGKTGYNEKKGNFSSGLHSKKGLPKITQNIDMLVEPVHSYSIVTLVIMQKLCRKCLKPRFF